MTDNLSPEDRKKTMRAVQGKMTKLERSLAAMLAGMHLNGWRKNAKELPGKPDVVFDHERLIIFADGCFWHGCPVCNRKLPQVNSSYWQRKIECNAVRDRDIDRLLRQSGWVVIRIWEHEMRDPVLRSKERTAIREIFEALNVDQQ
jgi:DNA mismatch endonuclease (patch repair protein)